MSVQKTRTFVLVSHVPSHFDDDKLRDVLRDNASEVMGVCALVGEGYAMALFGSKSAALAACSNFDDSGVDPPLKLRVIRQQLKSKVEDVFKSTVTVEGEEFHKKDLMPSRGYEEMLKGTTAPRWCAYTLKGEDCPDGVACRFLHKRQYQRTEKRIRVDGPVMPSASLAWDRIPEPLRIPRTSFKLGSKELRLLLSDDQNLISSLSEKIAAASSAFADEGGQTNLFIRLASVAPTDLPFSSEETLAQLRASAPMPASGIPTPLERDEYIANVVWSCNKLLRTTPNSAMGMLLRSPKVLQRLENADDEEIVVSPWRSSDTIFDEIRIFIHNRAVFCVVQKHDDVLSMKCLDELISEEETAAATRIEEFVHKVDAWLVSDVDLPENLCCCLNASVPSSGRPWIYSISDYATKSQSCTLFPSSPPELRCAPIWRKVKYARVPRYSPEQLAVLRK